MPIAADASTLILRQYCATELIGDGSEGRLDWVSSGWILARGVNVVEQGVTFAARLTAGDQMPPNKLESRSHDWLQHASDGSTTPENSKVPLKERMLNEIRQLSHLMSFLTIHFSGGEICTYMHVVTASRLLVIRASLCLLHDILSHSVLS